MSIVVQRLKAQDLQTLVDRKGRSYIGRITDEQARALEMTSFAYSVFVDGKLELCGGVTEYWANRGEAWAVLDPNCKAHFLALHHRVKRFLEICPIGRIEAGVELGFEAGHRWVKALGFRLEAPKMEAFFPDGKDAALYAWRSSWQKPAQR